MTQNGEKNMTEAELKQWVLGPAKTLRRREVFGLEDQTARTDSGLAVAGQHHPKTSCRKNTSPNIEPHPAIGITLKPHFFGGSEKEAKCKRSTTRSGVRTALTDTPRTEQIAAASGITRHTPRLYSREEVMMLLHLNEQQVQFLINTRQIIRIRIAGEEIFRWN